MYVQLLTDALSEWVLASDRNDVLAHAVECHRRMTLASLGSGETVYGALAAEVSYDRSLIKVCEFFDIASAPDNFANPSIERRRLEHELSLVGLDLAELSLA